MKAKITLLILCISSFVLHAQTEAMNQLDSAGLKNGKWIVYLDAQWNELKDSSGAVYSRFTWYDHGENTRPMGAGGGKNWKLIKTMGDTSKQDGITQLDGQYKWMDDEGRMRFVHVFKDGEYVLYKEFYTSGSLHQQFEFTKHLNNEDDHTYHVTIYDRKAKARYYYMRDGESGWTFYEYRLSQ